MSGNASGTIEPEVQVPEEAFEKEKTSQKGKSSKKKKNSKKGKSSKKGKTSKKGKSSKGGKASKKGKSSEGGKAPKKEETSAEGKVSAEAGVPVEEASPEAETLAEEVLEKDTAEPAERRRSLLERIPSPVRAALELFLFWWAAILICELVIHAAAFPDMGRFPTVVLFSAAPAALAAALTGLPTRGGKVLAWLVPPALFLVYAVQLVYHDIFNAFMSLIYVSAGGDAITQFWDIALEAINRCMFQLLVMAAPMAAFCVLRCKGRLAQSGAGVKAPLVLTACFAALSALAVLSLPLGGTGVSSSYTAFHSRSATVDRWTEHFGLLTAEALDLERMASGGRGGLSSDGPDLTAGAGGARNVLPGMDFDTLNTLTDKKELRALNDYFASLSGTGRNSYTGMFRGYNLIEICAESFSPYVIDPELTPTLYRLSHEGIVFENFYNSFPSVTSDGEYSLCMGMMINLKRVSFASSMDNYVPYCLGNMFSAIGVPARAYHNNYATFYNRINTHTNMGYEFKAIDFGLDMEKGHPASDLEMFQKTVDEYIGEEQFHTYYMTYSGHAPYNFDTNQMCQQNRALTEGIEASEPVRAYYCGELELERALAYLVERLEEAGIAQRTVIVLTGDHYPYGLPDEAYEELAGEAVEKDPFWRYRNSFICWTAGLEEPVIVDDYCCTQDILPTLLNLFGFAYDSRMLTGRDVLADCTHAALLKDGSILTKEFSYDGTSGELTWSSEEEGDEEQSRAVIEAIENQFAVAADVLDYDYYQFAFSELDLSKGREEHPVYTSYSDTAGTYYEEAAEMIARYGIVVATNEEGRLAGEDVLSRAQMAVMVSRWLGLSGDPDVLPYTDVRARWILEPLAGIWEAGLLPGGETEFRPSDPAVQEEAVDFLSAAAKYAGRTDARTWAEEIVKEAAAKQAAANAGIPENVLTRGAMTYILADLIRYAEENGLDMSASGSGFQGSASS